MIEGYITKAAGQDVLLLFADNSHEIFRIEGIEAVTGLSEKEALVYGDTKEDAYIFGLVNILPDGSPFLFTNMLRLAHEIDKNGLLSLFEYLGHELYHLAKIIQSKGISEASDDEEQMAEIIAQLWKDILPEFLEQINPD